LADGEEQALAIDIVKSDFNLTAADMQIYVTGGVTDFVIQTIARLFKKTILNAVVNEAKKIMETTLIEIINSDLKQYGTHFEVAGYGLDYS